MLRIIRYEVYSHELMIEMTKLQFSFEFDNFHSFDLQVRERAR